MTRTIAIATIAALTLTACSGNAGSDAADGAASGESISAADIADSAAQVVKPVPGLYRVTVEKVSLDMPGAPKQMAEMIEGAFTAGGPIEYCLTAKDVEDGFEEMARRSQSGECSYQRFDVSGGTVDAAMTCTQDGQTVKGTMAGTVTPTSSLMNIAMAMDVEGFGKGTLKMTNRHQRIGDCPAGE